MHLRSEFTRVLEEVLRSARSSLTLEVDGARYQRLFRPAERLILLGGGTIARALPL